MPSAYKVVAFVSGPGVPPFIPWILIRLDAFMGHPPVRLFDRWRILLTLDFRHGVIPIVTESDSRDSQKPTNLNRWRKQEVCDGFGDFVAVRL